MSRKLRRQLDFATGVLATISVVMIFFISPLLWLYMKDNACITVWVIGFAVAFIAVQIWEYRPKKKSSRRKEYVEE